MRRWLWPTALVLLFFGLLTQFGHAGFPTLLGVGAPPATGAGTSLTFTAGPTAQSGGATHTYSAVNVGAADPSRIVIVAIQSKFGAAGTLSVTINTFNATIAVSENSNATQYAGIAYLPVPTGTTANIVVSLAGGAAMSVSQIAVYSAIGYTTNPAGGASVGTKLWDVVNPGPMTVTATIPAGGFGISVFGTDRANTVTWSNATLDFTHNDVSTGDDIYALHTVTSGSQTPTSSSAVTFFQAAMACWGP